MLKSVLKDWRQVKKLSRLPYCPLVNTRGFFHRLPNISNANTFKFFNESGKTKLPIFNFAPIDTLANYQRRFISLNNNSEWESLLKELRDNESSSVLVLNCFDYDINVRELAAALKMNQTVRTLAVHGSEMTYDLNSSDAGELAEVLEVNSILESLDISINHIGVDGAVLLANALKMNQSLLSLDLSGNDIGVSVAVQFAETLKTNRGLQSLNIGHNSIGNVGAQALAEMLKVNQTLQSLCISYNKIGDAGSQALAEALKVNQALQKLNLAWNNIDAASAQALAEALKINQRLKSLGLFWNNIGEVGVTALAEALKVNQSLQSLDVSCNAIGDEGSQALAEALKINQLLKSLRLFSNDIGEGGGKALAEALKVNQSLQSLHLHLSGMNLRYNNIGVAGKQAIVNALENNYTLLKLGLDLSDLLDDDTKQLQQILQRNQEIKKCLAPIETFEKTGALDNRVIVSAITVLQSLVGNLNETHVIAENQRLLNALKYLSVDDGAEVLSLLEKPFNDRRLQSIAAQVQEQALRLCNGVIFKV